MKRNSFILAVFAVAVMVVSSCSNKEAAKDGGCDVIGSGGISPEPFYLSVFDIYNSETRKTVEYRTVGSDEGLRQFEACEVDFAGSDRIYTDEKIASLNIKPVIHIPTCMVAEALVYNLPGVKELRLSGDVLVDIYLGKITMWNDPRITALNPCDSFPEHKIIPVYRPEPCGRNYTLSSYFCVMSEEWKSKYGAHLHSNFPVGKPVNGNAGLANVVLETPYSIGYVGSDFATILKMPVAALRNAHGEFIYPTLKNVTAAANVELPDDPRMTLVNSPAEGAYPISDFTWFIVYKEQKYNDRTLEHVRNVVDFLYFMLGDDAQHFAEDVDFVPLPRPMIALGKKAIGKITYNGKPVRK